MVRTRFAPSPTGSLHVGNARIAVLNWLFTRQQGGAFVLRIEDTDVERGVAGAEETIFTDIRWLGLDWDEGPSYESRPAPGTHGPYRQSERLPTYHKLADRLRAAGLAYDCYCTPEEIAARRQLAIEQGRPSHYDRRCAALTAEEVARFRREGRTPALRFRVPDGGPVVVSDVVRGDIRVDRTEIGDFILLRADGYPTYNFAVVVDDMLMEITHVIRGSGHLSNAPRQVLLYEALGARPPVLAHVPMVLGPDRQKLSKRHGAEAITEYAREGYHPDALVNYLSLLSWSSPTGEELLTREQLIRDVSLERIGTADVVFDPAKLRWLSAKHIERMPLDELVSAVRPYIDVDAVPIPPDRLPLAIGAIRTHLATFSEVNDQLAAFFPAREEGEAAVVAADEHPPPGLPPLGGGDAPAEGMHPPTLGSPPDLPPLGGGNSEPGGEARRSRVGTASASNESAERTIAAARRHLDAVSEWTEPSLKAALAETSREAGVKGRALYEPLRLALTGREHGPPFIAMLLVQGRTRVLEALAGAQAS